MVPILHDGRVSYQTTVGPRRGMDGFSVVTPVGNEVDYRRPEVHSDTPTVLMTTISIHSWDDNLSFLNFKLGSDRKSGLCSFSQ